MAAPLWRWTDLRVLGGVSLVAAPNHKPARAGFFMITVNQGIGWTALEPEKFERAVQICSFVRGVRLEI